MDKYDIIYFVKNFRRWVYDKNKKSQSPDFGTRKR